MEKAHKEAGLIWNGRNEGAIIIKEEETKMRTSHR
jgi:hypothetical protein